MQNITKIRDLIQIRRQLSGSTGLVTTMGFLHDGHLSLINTAQNQNDHVIVSIFVNPLQFGSQDDLQLYPRDIEHDIKLLKQANADIVFLPETDELYPSNYLTYVDVKDITNCLEGKSRPEHFNGVTTVLTKLFNIIQPDRAYFGQKDAQQVAVVKKMVEDLNFPLEIITCKTIREKSGLALSSRNVRLSTSEHKEAEILYKSLTAASELFNKGEINAVKIKSLMKKMIETTKGKIDYISMANPITLHEEDIIEKGTLVSLAVIFGKTRLIDNIIL